MKSQAVREDISGMPGVSGEEKARGPPMSGGFAKLPGLVPGSWREESFSERFCWSMAEFLVIAWGRTGIRLD